MKRCYMIKLTDVMSQITPLPGVTTLKPGSATKPFFGVEPAILDEKGQEVEGVGEGYESLRTPCSALLCWCQFCIKLEIETQLMS